MPEKRPPHASARGTPIKRKAALQRTSTPLRSTPLGHGSALPREQPIKRKAAPKRQAISPASPAQRAKIKDKDCVVCGAPATTPMHLWPRGMGGCDDPLCVLPACWACHRAYDTKTLELLSHIVRDYRAEIAHAFLHEHPVAVLERLTASTLELHSLRPLRANSYD